MNIYYTDLRRSSDKPDYADLLAVNEKLSWTLFAAIKDTQSLAAAQLYARGMILSREHLDNLQKRAEDSLRGEGGEREAGQIYGLSPDEERAVGRVLKDLPAVVMPSPIDLDELARQRSLERGIYEYRNTAIYLNEDLEKVTNSHLKRLADLKSGFIYIWYRSRFFLQRNDAVIRAIVEHLPTVIRETESKGRGKNRTKIEGQQKGASEEAPAEERRAAKEWPEIGLRERLDQYVLNSPRQRYTTAERDQVQEFYQQTLGQLSQMADPLSKRPKFKAAEIRHQRRCIETTMERILVYWDLMADSLNNSGESNYVLTHAFKTSILAMQVATLMGVPKMDVINLGLASVLQDIGMRECRHLIDKTTPLTPDELRVIRQHPVHSVVYLEKTVGISPLVLQIVLQSHERFDGSGYPNGLVGTGIHLLGRILAAVNIYIAMISPRPFRSPLPSYNAIVTIVFNAYHKLLDRDVAKALLEVLSVCPIGMIVKLDTGEIARVTSANSELYTRPVVSLLTDAEGNLHSSLPLLDLASSNSTIAEIVTAAEMPAVDVLGPTQELISPVSGREED